MGSTSVRSKTQIISPSIPGLSVLPVERPQPPRLVKSNAAHKREPARTGGPTGTASKAGPREGLLQPVSSSSTKCVTFLLPDPPLPQGVKKKKYDARRIRDSSPPYSRFEWLVSFDNNILGGLNEQLSFSYTLAMKHKAYSPKGYARVFMIEVEDCASPNAALQWLLDELVEDGDLIVCVHIASHVFNLTADEHKQEARVLLESIMAKVDEDRAISIILEFAGGRITHSDFQSMIKMYQPSTLVVGYDDQDSEDVFAAATPQNRFMEYCLEHSPVPVIVARPAPVTKLS